MGSSAIAPASERTAHRMGAACPLESTNTSAREPEGSEGAQRISSKNRTETISAADMQVVGCPEPASAVVSRLRRRSFCAIYDRAGASGIWGRILSTVEG